MSPVLSPTEIGVAGIFIILVLKEVKGLVTSVKNNGKSKDETKEYKILHPCKDDPRWVDHISDTHSTFEAVTRCENDHDKLGDTLTALVTETKVQTTLLKQIAKNGKM